MPNGLSPIPLAEVARYPRPGFVAPGFLAFSPDDRWITALFSPEGDLSLKLFIYDPETGAGSALLEPPGGGVREEDLPLEEKLRRERQRQLAQGVSSYAWASKGNRLLVPLPDGLYVLDLSPEGQAAPRKLLDASGGPLLDPRFSPDGEWVAYIQAGELWVISTTGGAPRQVTTGARESGVTHGLAEFIAQEEMGRSQGYWWSPDSRSLAFAEVDESHIPIYRILHQGQDAVGEEAQEDHRYPFAGQANARVRLGVVSIAGGQPAWMDLGEGDLYLARAGWLPDRALWAQVENREQTALDLVRFDPRTGRRTPLLMERSDQWINLHDLFRPLESPRYAGGFIWASERSGYRRLSLHDSSGGLVHDLTQGEWQVDELVGVDEAGQRIYFTGTRDGPTEKHLYAVSLDGGEPLRLTEEPGWHTAIFDHACRRFIDIYDALDQPPVVTLRSLTLKSENCADLPVGSRLVSVLWDGVDPRLEALDLEPPELVELQSGDREPLFGLLYRPPASFGPGPYPAIVSVYGGPHVQMVKNSWTATAALREQAFSRLGFLVFMLDNRGSARRGLAFEGVIQGNLGNLEVEDQAAGVLWLVEQGLADPQRVGVMGWSYGGYMALMCLARRPGVFKAALAGAPVTSWDGYDTHYTERYMGTPQSNPQGYAASSVLNHVEDIQGRLLVVHGLIDENVHFRHTARLINALIRQSKPYDLLIFPDERHTPRRLEDRVYMEEHVRDFFLENL